MTHNVALEDPALMSWSLIARHHRLWADKKSLIYISLLRISCAAPWEQRCCSSKWLYGKRGQKTPIPAYLGEVNKHQALPLAAQQPSLLLSGTFMMRLKLYRDTKVRNAAGIHELTKLPAEPPPLHLNFRNVVKDSPPETPPSWSLKPPLLLRRRQRILLCVLLVYVTFHRCKWAYKNESTAALTVYFNPIKSECWVWDAICRTNWEP